MSMFLRCSGCSDRVPAQRPPERKDRLQEERFDVLRSKAEYELEGKRSPFSFDEGKAEVSYIFPIRVFGKDGVRVKELFFDKAVNVKCIECCDLSFDK